MFDIIKFLDTHSIEYSETTKHATKGWVNIKCVFCDDHSDHLGIFVEHSTFHCYKCGEKGGKIRLVEGLLNCTREEAISIIRSFSDNSSLNSSRSISKPKDKPFAEKCLLPLEATPFLPKLHRSYLISRGFDPDYLVRKYDLHSCYTDGDYKYRIIIPIYYHKKLVSFTTRDVTGKQTPKYLNAKIINSVLDPKSCLYNIDRVERSMLILEGPADVWRIGDGSVCTFGSEFSDSQVKLLIEEIKLKSITKVRVMFDPEPVATKKAKELAWMLSSFARDTAVIEYDGEKDPGSMSESEVRQVRMAVF